MPPVFALVALLIQSTLLLFKLIHAAIQMSILYSPQQQFNLPRALHGLCGNVESGCFHVEATRTSTGIEIYQDLPTLRQIAVIPDCLSNNDKVAFYYKLYFFT